MEWPSNGGDNATTRYYMLPSKTPVSGMGDILLSHWPKGTHGHPHKQYRLLPMLLMTLQSLTVSSCCWRHHFLMSPNRENWASALLTLQPCWPAFRALKDTIHAARGEEQSSVSPSFKLWDPQLWPVLQDILVQLWHKCYGVTSHFF